MYNKPRKIVLSLLIILINCLCLPGTHLNYDNDNYLIINNLGIINIGNNYTASVQIVNSSNTAVSSEDIYLEYFLNDEYVMNISLPDIPPQSEETYTFSLGLMDDYYYHLKVELFYENNQSNSVLTTSFIVGNSPLVINEVLFKELPDNQEWIEIYNRSDYTIVMNDFYFLDAANTITVFSGVISPKTYMVICRNKERFLEYYQQAESQNVIESISWAILNNDRENILLLDKYNTDFDYMEYTAPASYPHDVSLERVNPYDNNSDWKRCLSPELSTPTFPNSHMPLKYDIAITESSAITENSVINHNVIVENKGYMLIDSFQLICYAYSTDIENVDDNMIVYSSHIYSQEVVSTVSFVTEKPVSEYITFKYVLYSDADMDSSNNHSVSFFNNNALPVVINEIMFRTFPGEPKWIELFVNDRYKYLDSMVLYTERYSVDFSIGTSDYMIITNNSADSLLLLERYGLADTPIYTGLTNLYVSGEELTLADPSGNIIEKFAYESIWSLERGVSTERVNPRLTSTSDNWGYSVAPNGSTPGRQNSIFTKFIPVKTSLNIAPNPFSPARGERTIIYYEFPEKMNRVTCRIFDLKGRLINTIINQEVLASSGTIIWDGYRNDNTRLPVGVYIIFVEATGYDSEKVYQDKKVVVIGK